jgi:aspartyl protease family protein
MTIGFMALGKPARLSSLAALLLLFQLAADAADIAVTALFNGKAVIVVDNGKPRTLSVGDTTPDGVKLVSASSESAVVEYAGKRQTLRLGEGTRLGAGASASAGGSGQVTLTVGAGGHFWANGAINGVAIRFLVDTGATSIALSSEAAKRMGLNYTAGTRVGVRTANAVTSGHRIALDSVRFGDITLTNVEALVLEGRYPEEALLGMSFLGRTQMKREGDTLTLVRRY